MENTLKENLMEILAETPGIGWSPSARSMIADHLIANNVALWDWIPVTEELPIEDAKAYAKEWDDEPEYLVMIDRGYLPTTLYYDWEENVWYRINSALKREEYNVTHWLPLPKPPRKD